MRRLQTVATVVAFSLLLLALLKELRTAPGLRTWRGTILRVPYNFRPYGSLHELTETCWNPQGNIIVAQPFGVGWSINLPAFLRRLDLWP